MITDVLFPSFYGGPWVSDGPGAEVVAGRGERLDIRGEAGERRKMEMERISFGVPSNSSSTLDLRNITFKVDYSVSGSFSKPGGHLDASILSSHFPLWRDYL